MRRRAAALLLALFTSSPLAGAQTAPRAQVGAMTVTVISTMLVGMNQGGIGEWGFAGVLEADGRRLLIDTGARAETVLRNAEELGVDLSTITDVVITHNHADHTGGLLTLRREMARKHPRALSQVHVVAGIFRSRLDPQGRETNGLLPIREAYERLGGTFVEHDAPFQWAPGIWVLGPVTRTHPERNYNTALRLQGPGGPVEDTVPEDTAVVVNTAEGLVVISGCGHAGIVNTLEHARRVIRDVPIEAAIGGFHLFGASDRELDWTAARLKAAGVRRLLGAHCTGIEAVFRVRQLVGLSRADAVVGAVGSSFTLGKGITSPGLAR